MAGRLSENPHNNVLLLEAGPEEPIAPSVPIFAFTAPKTPVDWQFETVPQKNACLANDGICYWPRGKMLCGSACMSGREKFSENKRIFFNNFLVTFYIGMMYTRGSPSIYDEWESNGNPGWNFTTALQYFKKSENNMQPLSQIEPEFHGFNGPMTVNSFPYIPPFASSLLSAVREMGYEVRDVNGKNQTGFTVASMMLTDSVRASPNRMYLRPAIRRKNLRVFIESYVVKVDFDVHGNKAIGIRFLDKWGILRKVKARKEVILTGGVVGTPQLLLLSGVGPKDDLQQLQIPVVKNLAVGRNLHFHFGVSAVVKFKNIPTSFTNEALHEYVNKGTGPFASTGLTQISAFLESSYTKKNLPDVQLFIDEFSDVCSQYERDHNYTSLAFRSIYLLTKCRGTIKLQSVDPTVKPLIDPNYLCNEDEVNALVETIRMLQKFVNASALRDKLIEFDTGDNEMCRSLRKDSDVYWKCLIHQYTLGENHHAGTVKMGASDDPTSVVDPQFRIHGIPNLRVVDASIMPTPINCNTIAPVIMFAEKASDSIKNDWK